MFHGGEPRPTFSTREEIMIGFLVVAQYAKDDIPLGLYSDRDTAMDRIRELQDNGPDSLHIDALESMEVMGRDASLPIEGDELTLTGFGLDGKITLHQVYGLDRFDEDGDDSDASPG